MLEIADRSHALRGNAAQDAPRPFSNATQSAPGGMPMQSIGTIWLDIQSATDQLTHTPACQCHP
ncbi:hypothetical protein, partial [Pseudomonas viridiflava]|uniref:hypothetical protein n=1 Tax=Pseudomonas viridiflava TaxID=33069 RepID=UPI0019CFE90F